MNEQEFAEVQSTLKLILGTDNEQRKLAEANLNTLKSTNPDKYAELRQSNDILEDSEALRARMTGEGYLVLSRIIAA